LTSEGQDYVIQALGRPVWAWSTLKVQELALIIGKCAGARLLFDPGDGEEVS
jgi:hypothetical protein